MRFLRSVFVPEDGTCFCLYEAPSAEDVHEAVRRAALPVGVRDASARIVESERTHEKGDGK